jgi:hypothetical protein
MEFKTYVRKRFNPLFIFVSRCPACGEWCKLHWLLLDTASFEWNTRRSRGHKIFKMVPTKQQKAFCAVESFSDTVYFTFKSLLCFCFVTSFRSFYSFRCIFFPARKLYLRYLGLPFVQCTSIYRKFSLGITSFQSEFILSNNVLFSSPVTFIFTSL